jgi:hypothetical protein
MLQSEDVGRGQFRVVNGDGRAEDSDDWRMPMEHVDCDPDSGVRKLPILSQHERSLAPEEPPDDMVVER